MVRARIHSVGDRFVATNGYDYTFQEIDGRLVRVLTHHLIAREKYGRAPGEMERVYFIDNDRTNLDPSNIEYRLSGRLSLEGARDVLVEKIKELRRQLRDIESQIENSRAS